MLTVKRNSRDIRRRSKAMGFTSFNPSYALRSTHPTGGTFSFLFDRQPVRAYVYSHAFGLFSILVELITEHGNDDD